MRPWFRRADYPQVRCRDRKGTVTPNSFGTRSMKFQLIPARAKVVWRFMAGHQGSEPEVPRNTVIQAAVTHSRDSIRMLIRVVSLSIHEVLSKAEIHDLTLCIPVWPSLPSSAPYVAFADGNCVYYSGVRCWNPIYWIAHFNAVADIYFFFFSFLRCFKRCSVDVLGTFDWSSSSVNPRVTPKQQQTMHNNKQQSYNNNKHI